LGSDGKHEVATVLQRVELADEVTVWPAGETAVEGFPEDTLVAGALDALTARTGVRFAAHLRKEIPVAAGLGGGSSDAATALALANDLLEEPLPRRDLHVLASALGADVPFFLSEGPQLGERDGTELTPCPLPQGLVVVLALPHGAHKPSTAAVYRAFDERDGAAGFASRREALLDALAGLYRTEDLSRLPHNDLASSPLADRLRGLGAVRADVTGAGPCVYGLFVDEPGAREAAEALSDDARVWVTRTRP
ncbi:MAG: 4-(cytidine 5'-diphospho)-2-C-methyl-D-erythritol kinase, partial [Gaiella sp.]